MPLPDDNYLTPYDLEVVRKRARQLMDKAGAWQRFPTPIEDILSAADLQVAPKSVFDPAVLMAFLTSGVKRAKNLIKSALSKVFGIYDADAKVIHIDETVVVTKQRFLKLHETGHHELPTHRRIFKFFQDCEKTLDSDTADRFEREANNFARIMLFQDNLYASLAADSRLEIKALMNLGKKFGASNYASGREFVRTNHRSCALYVLEPVEESAIGPMARVRRTEASPLFVSQFGMPSDTVIAKGHSLYMVLPINRRMTSPRPVFFSDRNGQKFEGRAEAFNTTHNILILIYPQEAVKLIVPVLS